MLNVNYLYEFVLKLIRKNQSGGLSSTEFQYHWNDSQAAYQDDLLGRFQAMNTGKTGPNTGLLENETILQKLSPFTKPSTINIIDGSIEKPSDFIYRLALRINGVDVYKINQNQIATVNANVIDPPSVNEDKYYFVEYEDYYYILPNTLPTVDITSAELDYISTVTNIVWGYTFEANGKQVYNAGTSVQPLWDSNSCREITKRMLKNLGVSFKDRDFASFGQTVIQSGE